MQTSRITTLDGMTSQIWDSLTQADRVRLRDNSGLSPQLIGLEGWRVEVTVSGPFARKRYRFIVGKSTGWRPCHLEISRRSARGGFPAEMKYDTIRKIENVFPSNR